MAKREKELHHYLDKFRVLLLTPEENTVVELALIAFLDCEIKVREREIAEKILKGEI